MKLPKLITIPIIIFFLSSVLFVVFAPKVFAQQSPIRTITIVPPTVEVTLDPGGKSEGILKIINDSPDALSFTVAPQDFIVKDDNGTPDFLGPDKISKKYSAASWIAITPNSFTVMPHQKQILQYFIQIPGDARPGGHYAGALYTPFSVIGVKSTGAGVNTQVGTLFYITVNGNINEFARITQFLANSFQEYGPISIHTQIKNFGDLHITPRGNIRVTDMLGRTNSVMDLHQVNIFPEAARNYANTFGNQFMIGPFTATLFATYGRNNSLPLIAKVTIWIFPWKITLVALLIIIAIALGIIYWKKRKQLKDEPATTQTNEQPSTELPHQNK